VLCRHGYHALHYVTAKTTMYDPQWIAIRVSFGAAGILMQVGFFLGGFFLHPHA